MSPNELLRRLCLLSLSIAVLPAQAEDGEIEIQFEPVGFGPGGPGFGPPGFGDGPMGMGGPVMEIQGGNPADLLNMMAQGGRPGGQNMRGPARGGREAELDDMLGQVFKSMMSAGPQPQMMRGGMMGGPGMMSGGPQDNGVVMIEGPNGAEVMSIGGDSAGPMGGMVGGGNGGNPRNSIPAALLRDLLPGPMGPMVMQTDHPQPFAAPDPFVMNIMQDLDRAFTKDIMPAVHKAASKDRVPNSCEQDIKTKCAGARSALHCLGYNHDSISDQCRKDVSKSVPFVCAQAIDKYCDVLQTGLLSCLYDHMDSLHDQCRDAVLTTKHVINKVNSQKASIVDPKTGAKTVSTPEVKSSAGTAATPTQREANLDARLGLAPAAKPTPQPVVLQTETKATPEKPGAASIQPKSEVSKVLASKPSDVPFQPQSQSPYQFWQRASAAFFCCVAVGMLVYMFAFTENTITKSVQNAIVQQKGPEGLKLINNVELPKSTEC